MTGNRITAACLVWILWLTLPLIADDDLFGYEHRILEIWNGGGNSEFDFTNSTGEGMDSWTISFQTNVTINSFWHGDIVSSENGFYIISNAYYNGSLPDGATIYTGFNWSGYDIMIENFRLYREGEVPEVPDVQLEPVLRGNNMLHRRGPSENSELSVAPGYFSTLGNQIVDAEGTPVRIAAIAWFGLESYDLAPHGLWARNYKSMMDQMLELGFNTIRLPYCNELFDPETQPVSINYQMNPELLGKSGIELIDAIVEYASEIGLRVFLDHHRSDAGVGALGKDLWYTEEYPEERWIDDWAMLAERYQGNPTVIGADLHNEPHGPATWGSGVEATDWRLAAERAAAAIHAVEPGWLIIVEGVATFGGNEYWWGGNLQGVADFPVRLDQPNKLVYSPHAYPPSIFDQSWFNDPNYPENLAALWDDMWGYIYFEEIAPILLGEWGSRFENPDDLLWLDKMALYLNGDRSGGDGTTSLPEGQQGMSWSWWSWNPNSVDTGGILEESWQNPVPEKLAYLKPLQFSFGTEQHHPIAHSNWVTLTVTLTYPTTEEITVQWITIEDTAREGIDYHADSGTLIFTPEATEQTIQVEILPGDQNSPDPARFGIELFQPSAGTIATPFLTVTILGYPEVEDENPDPVSAWEQWVAQYFSEGEQQDPSLSGPGAEVLSDGWPNLLRFAVGLAPDQPIPPDVWPRLVVNGAGITFYYQVRHHDILSVEVSADLVEWMEVDWPELGRTSKGEGVEGIVLSVPLSSGQGPLFVRLKVTR